MIKDKINRCRVNITKRFAPYRLLDFVIIGSAKCGTTSVQSYLSDHPSVYIPRVEEWTNGETGLLLSECSESIKGLSNEDIRVRPKRFFRNYMGESVIGERSTDYTKHPYRHPRIEKLEPSTKVLFFYREPVNRIKKLYNHHLRNRPNETSKDFRKEDVDYYIKTSMYYNQTKKWIEEFESFCAVNIEADDERIFESVAGYIGVEPLSISCRRKNVNDRKEVEIDLTLREKSKITQDYETFKRKMEASSVLHVDANR
jgi:hypothetical protein